MHGGVRVSLDSNTARATAVPIQPDELASLEFDELCSDPSAILANNVEPAKSNPTMRRSTSLFRREPFEDWKYVADHGEVVLDEY